MKMSFLSFLFFVLAIFAGIAGAMRSDENYFLKHWTERGDKIPETPFHKTGPGGLLYFCLCVSVFLHCCDQISFKL